MAKNIRILYLLNAWILLTIAGCHSCVKKGKDISAADIMYLQKQGLLQANEDIILFECHGPKIFKPFRQSGNFFTDKRIAAYWVDKDPKRSSKNFAFYQDIDSITTTDLSTALTYASYLTVHLHNGSKFKVFVDGGKEKVSRFFKAALSEWKKHKKNKKVASGQRVDVWDKDTTLHGDRIIYPFKDTTYRAAYHVFKKGSYNEEENNAVFSLVHVSGNKTELLFRDSLYSMHSIILLRDMNGDHVRDIMIFYYTGPRANPTYHFYLRDTTMRKLVRIEGSENLPNPDFDYENHLITSSALYADKVWWEFHRINKQNKVVDLGNGFETGQGDEDNKYEKALNAVLKKYGKAK